jgi:hypothetical protein
LSSFVIVCRCHSSLSSLFVVVVLSLFVVRPCRLQVVVHVHLWLPENRSVDMNDCDKEWNAQGRDHACQLSLPVHLWTCCIVLN